jgi:hypothetical protein
MKKHRDSAACGVTADPLMTELLILHTGEILVHNLTPAMAAILSELNPEDGAIQPRAGVKWLKQNNSLSSNHELPN